MPKKYICVYYKINSKLLQNQTIYTVIVFISINFSIKLKYHLIPTCFLNINLKFFKFSNSHSSYLFFSNSRKKI